MDGRRYESRDGRGRQRLEQVVENNAGAIVESNAGAVTETTFSNSHPTIWDLPPIISVCNYFLSV